MIGFSLSRGIGRLLARLPVGRARVEADRGKAAALLAEGRFAEADSVLLAALRRAPDDVGLATSFALSANDRGLFAEALRRWERLAEIAPDRPIAWYGIAANRRGLGLLHQARMGIDEALARFPHDACAHAEAARIAHAQKDNDAVLHHWSTAVRLGDPHPDWLVSLAWSHLAQNQPEEAEAAIETLRQRCVGHPALAELQWKVQRSRQRADYVRAQDEIERQRRLDTGSPITPAALFAHFESLGDNCEFGLVQRYSHIEPLGLFRFSSASGDGLIRVLSRDLEDYGSEGDLEIIYDEFLGAFDCRSKSYNDFRYHTEVGPGAITPEALLAREIKKVAYLKKRLVSDLRSAEKIFVRKGGAPEKALELFQTIRRYGPVILLFVQTAEGSHEPGQIDLVEDGFIRGWMTRFAPYGNAHEFDMSCWAEVCRKTLSLARGHSFALVPNGLLQENSDWAFTELCSAGAVEQPFFPIGETRYVCLTADTRRETSTVALRYMGDGFEARAELVFTLWVWIPTDFVGTIVDVHFTNVGRSFVSGADLSRRNEWQKVWTSARLPKCETRTAAGLRVTGKKGTTIFIAAWRLETGTIPNHWNLCPEHAGS